MPTSNLFLALFPDFYAATQMAALGEALRSTHGLTGRILGVNRFHVSLHRLDARGIDELDDRKRIDAAAEEVAAFVPPFAVQFDQVVTFSGKSARRPVVLLSKDGDRLLRQCWLDLALVLRRQGISCDLGRFQPHVTLLYDTHHLEIAAIDPVCWIVNGFTLVHSLVGKTTYLPLNRWLLHG